MGKKKSSKSRRLRPILERAISQGEIYCKTRSYSTDRDHVQEQLIYDITFGRDANWWMLDSREEFEVVGVSLIIQDDGEIRYWFMSGNNHMLNREHDKWFREELKEIITLHKMGAYESNTEDRKNYEWRQRYAIMMSRQRK